MLVIKLRPNTDTKKDYTNKLYYHWVFKGYNEIIHKLSGTLCYDN